ncbi:KEOPS complex subunit Cgi121, partial [Methanobrevibacter sp. OttesenSCG-928-I08]|nr:KEOPS complex subunit Cgi121 [Methanobrevibacter sp. OttesenSCG-928-I08]
MNFKDLEVYGFKGNIEDVDETLNFLDNLINSTSQDCIVQLLDAKAIAGKNHIRHAVNQAILAFKRNENIANELSVEICLRTSAQRQISKAFNILGIKKGEMDLCLVMINCPNDFYDKISDRFIRDDDVLLPDESILQKTYDISQKELQVMDIQDILIDKITKI